MYGMDIHAGSYLQDPAFYKRTPFERRVFNNPASYLLPISKTELEKATSVVQNIGY